MIITNKTAGEIFNSTLVLFDKAIVILFTSHYFDYKITGMVRFMIGNHTVPESNDINIMVSFETYPFCIYRVLFAATVGPDSYWILAFSYVLYLIMLIVFVSLEMSTLPV